MASEQVESLFGELRSAVASHRVLAAHEIAKSIYSLDRAFHAEAVIRYLQSHPMGDGAMTRDTLVRLEQFKEWVRETLDEHPDNMVYQRDIVRFLKSF